MLYKKYKSDFFLPTKNKIIEVKSLLSKTKTTKFPLIHGVRSIRQLQEIYQLLKEGYNVDYYIILLSSVIQNIIFDDENMDFNNLFKLCVNKGLNLKYFNCLYLNEKFILKEAVDHAAYFLQ